MDRLKLGVDELLEGVFREKFCDKKINKKWRISTLIIFILIRYKVF